MSKTVTMNLKVREYTNKVLGVLKEKYGLKDKGQALDKFAQMYGDEYVGNEVREEVVKEMIESSERHMKKHGFRSRSVAELRKKIEAE